MKNKHSGLSVINLLFEAILIVISVFLGLFVNEWRMEQRERMRADKALLEIKEEIKSNQERIVTIAAYHILIKDSLNALLYRTDFHKKSITFQELFTAMPNGFGVPGLQQQSWTLANRLGSLEHIDYKTAGMLSKLYDLQNFYMNKYNYVTENFYLASNVDSHIREGLVNSLAFLAGDITIHEKDLAAAYVKAIENLDLKR